jgi:hypothetical protein
MEIPEQIALNFHRVYEMLAPHHGYETREASRTDWNDVPDQNKRLMIDTVQVLLDTDYIRPGEAVDTR